ncbi:MAG: hypothetical protein DWQ19_12400 [Crenarchaeota archaeon]|nr:MAG: hypothetical protein DWQ19_12400 [Thermoproteota archaeon]
MTYFQNVFADEFNSAIGPIGDRQLNQGWKCPPNTGRGRDLVITWATPTFDLSGNDSDGNSKANLTIRVSNNDGQDLWGELVVDVRTGADSASAVTVAEVVSLLNADTNFSGWFTAESKEVKNSNGTSREAVLIRQIQQHERMKFYIVNGGAEEVLRFNERSGIAELPTWFDRHTIANRKNFTDSLGFLIALNTANNVDAAVIDNAKDNNDKSLGFSSGTVQADWQLLKGRSDNFLFTKNTVDGSDRVTETILYPAGAKVGDLAKKTSYSYTSDNIHPDQVTEEPYVLTSGDLVTP